MNVVIGVEFGKLDRALEYHELLFTGYKTWLGAVLFHGERLVASGKVSRFSGNRWAAGCTGCGEGVWDFADAINLVISLCKGHLKEAGMYFICAYSRWLTISW